MADQLVIWVAAAILMQQRSPAGIEPGTLELFRELYHHQATRMDHVFKDLHLVPKKCSVLYLCNITDVVLKKDNYFTSNPLCAMFFLFYLYLYKDNKKIK